MTDKQFKELMAKLEEIRCGIVDVENLLAPTEPIEIGVVEFPECNCEEKSESVLHSGGYYSSNSSSWICPVHGYKKI